MLKINKGRLRIARILEWGGIFTMIVGSFFAVLLPAYAYGIILAGGAASLIGASMADKLYRCPACGSRLIVRGSAVDVLMCKTPPYCPQCGEAIHIVAAADAEK